MCSPFGGGMGSDVEMNHAAPVMSENHKDKQDSKANGRHDKEICRNQAPDVIVEKSAPSLRGRFRWRAMNLATVAWDTSIPSLSSSPWMRGAPQRGFALLIFRMRSRTSSDTSGLPGVRRPLFHAQYKRNPLRCQEITVSGLTMVSAERQPDHSLDSHTQKTRSLARRRTRPL